MQWRPLLNWDVERAAESKSTFNRLIAGDTFKDPE